tara:strand:+ start:3868 stop:4854 length:987 start_codon:yes stop_codon:yes gene_type:complete
MIHKSYLVENNFYTIRNKIALFYGENLGLQNDFKETIKKLNLKNKVLNFDQEEIINSSTSFFNELNNQSLFENTKIIIINNTSDKILEIIKEAKKIVKDDKIYLFGNLLEKKSKIRNFFERENDLDIIPCYKDNIINLKKLIETELKDIKGLSPQIINFINESTSFNRVKLKNELDKIKTFFVNSTINLEELQKLLNLKEDDDFNDIKNHAICGNSKETNNLLSTCVLENEKVILYITLINQRLTKLNEIDLKNKNLERVINEIKPPVFWKEKPIFLVQAKTWNKYKLYKALSMTYTSEIKMKSSSEIDKKILLKKLIIDICNLANAA